MHKHEEIRKEIEKILLDYDQGGYADPFVARIMQLLVKHEEEMFKIDAPTLDEAQRKFEKLHSHADTIVANKLDGVIQVIYYSPIAQMRKVSLEAHDLTKKEGEKE